MICQLKLQPQLSLRWCSHCGKSIGTCYPHAMACPYCAELMPSVEHNWPHWYSRGHSTTHGGVCDVEVKR